MDAEFLLRNRFDPPHLEANELAAIFAVSVHTVKPVIINQKLKME